MNREHESQKTDNGGGAGPKDDRLAVGHLFGENGDYKRWGN